ncbi:hypothetical protein IKG31_03070 [Candidatus Saccharibacteria bacterium]|nr:hypothetical protein [Candidatus Saccharibacteria bacterium]
MFKRLFGGFLATIVLVLGGISNTVIATGGQIVIDNLLDLCQSMLVHGYSLDGTGTCNAYSRSQTSATNIYSRIYVWDNIVLKNLDLSFAFPYSPFIIYDGGSLTIDGGHYSSPSCVIWIQYDNETNPGYFVPSSSIAINSGVFEANLSSHEGADVPSPVCLISRNRLTTEEAEVVIASYLPIGRHFVDLGTRSVSENIDVSEGNAHLSKSYDETDAVDYLQTTIVAVVEDEGLGSEIEEEVTEPENEQEEIVDSSEDQEKIILPKAPDSGISRTMDIKVKTRGTTLISVIFTVVIFTTLIWGHCRKNR